MTNDQIKAIVTAIVQDVPFSAEATKIDRVELAGRIANAIKDATRRQEAAADAARTVYDGAVRQQRRMIIDQRQDIRALSSALQLIADGADAAVTARAAIDAFIERVNLRNFGG